MRPYTRRRRRSGRARGGGGIVQYLTPFLHNLKALWKLGTPFPVSGKITITLMTCILLFLPLLYFLVPPAVTILLVNYFSGRWINFDDALTVFGETCAGMVDATKFRRKAYHLWKLFDKFTAVFFIYDYYQILRYFRQC